MKSLGIGYKISCIKSYKYLNVKFERKGKDKKQVSVYPVEAVEKAKKEVAAKA